MGIFGQVVKSVAVGCAVCLTLSVPTALTGFAHAAQTPATTADVVNGLEAGGHPALSDARTSTSSASWLVDDFGVPAGAWVVYTPGTDDKPLYLYSRIDQMRGNLKSAIVEYPQSVFPIISGRSGALLPIFAPTYDGSVDVAIDHNLQTMRGLKGATDDPYVVYTGYSQGAEAVGDATERAYAAGLLDPDRTQIVLVSDPRGPWGLKQWATHNVLVSAVFNAVGATADGARNPADTGVDLQVTSVIIDGDPAANFQWVWYRPLTSLVVDLAGYLAVHANFGPESYATLDQIEDKEVLYSRDGKTTYVVYHAEHPLAQVIEMGVGAVGIHLSDTQVDQLNDLANRFYPLQQPSPERAASTAPVTSTRPIVNSVPDQASVSRPRRQFVGVRGQVEREQSAVTARPGKPKDAGAVANSHRGRTPSDGHSGHRSAPRGSANAA